MAWLLLAGLWLLPLSAFSQPLASPSDATLAGQLQEAATRFRSLRTGKEEHITHFHLSANQCLDADFVQNLTTLVTLSEEARQEHEILLSTLNTLPATHSYTPILSQWADRFYTLRRQLADTAVLGYQEFQTQCTGQSLEEALSSRDDEAREDTPGAESTDHLPALVQESITTLLSPQHSPLPSLRQVDDEKNPSPLKPAAQQIAQALSQVAHHPLIAYPPAQPTTEEQTALQALESFYRGDVALSLQLYLKELQVMAQHHSCNPQAIHDIWSALFDGITVLQAADYHAPPHDPYDLGSVPAIPPGPLGSSAIQPPSHTQPPKTTAPHHPAFQATFKAWGQVTATVQERVHQASHPNNTTCLVQGIYRPYSLTQHPTTEPAHTETYQHLVNRLYAPFRDSTAVFTVLASPSAPTPEEEAPTLEASEEPHTLSPPITTGAHRAASPNEEGPTHTSSTPGTPISITLTTTAQGSLWNFEPFHTVLQYWAQRYVPTPAPPPQTHSVPLSEPTSTQHPPSTPWVSGQPGPNSVHAQGVMDLDVNDIDPFEAGTLTKASTNTIAATPAVYSPPSRQGQGEASPSTSSDSPSPTISDLPRLDLAPLPARQSVPLPHMTPPPRKKPAPPFEAPARPQPTQTRPHISTAAPTDNTIAPDSLRCEMIVTRYRTKLKTAVSQNWKPPRPRRRGTYITTLQYKVQPQGHEISDVEMIRSSGDTGIDQSAIRRLYALETVFPPLPACLQGNALPMVHDFKVQRF